MKLGYMTNAFGPLVGSGGGVTSVKDTRYITLCNDEAVIKNISKIGFEGIELFDGNLDKFIGDKEAFINLMNQEKMSLIGVYVGANFIYQDALADELWRIEHTVDLASNLGAKHLVVGGGAIRSGGNTDQDYHMLAKALDKVSTIADSYGMIASYHPHLGSMVETPSQIEQLFSKTAISFCPDIAHLAAGGGDPLEIITKYAERIHYVHLKDLKEGEFVPLGRGELNINEIIQFFENRKYSGDWLVEIDGYSGDPIEACKESYQYLKKTLLANTDNNNKKKRGE